jgi:hypothetical protein
MEATQFSDSLCARMLKAKYYPNGELVDTVFPGEASPTWRAIEHGLDLVKRGIIWRISSVTKVNIWRDPWIPRPPSRRISLKKGRSRLRWVSQLMKEGTQEWDEQMLRSCLHAYDVEEVLKIRPMRNRHEDIIAWFYETSSIFTVKSAYRLAINEVWANRAGSSTSNHLDMPLFKVLWNAEVPSKFHIFAWKVAFDGIAM